MTEWTRSFPYLAHVHFVHILPIFASPEGEGFAPSPMVTLNWYPKILSDYRIRQISSLELMLISGVAREDLRTFKEEIVHQFHVISEDVISQVKQVAEGVANVNEKLDRTRQELKTEIQETRQGVLAAIKFSYAELHNDTAS